MDNNLWPILWTACGVVTVAASVFAGRSRRARLTGRAAVGFLFVVGGALLHVINLATGVGYAGFADPAHFAWVTDSWRAVVAPNEVLFIGLLVVFEATIGVLALCGGRKTQAGYIGVIAFYSLLWIFGWFETVWCLLMIVPMLVLLHAERRAAASEAAGRVDDNRMAEVGS